MVNYEQNKLFNIYCRHPWSCWKKLTKRSSSFKIHSNVNRTHFILLIHFMREAVLHAWQGHLFEDVECSESVTAKSLSSYRFYYSNPDVLFLCFLSKQFRKKLGVFYKIKLVIFNFLYIFKTASTLLKIILGW